MATKTFCDRCGKEINLKNSYVTYTGMRRIKAGINDEDYELCPPCANELELWLNKKKGKSNCG